MAAGPDRGRGDRRRGGPKGVSSAPKGPRPSLIVTLESVPLEGLEWPLHLDPGIMGALVTRGEEEPPAFTSALSGIFWLRLLDSRLEVRASFRVGVALACDRCLAQTSTVLPVEIEEALTLAATGRDGASAVDEDALAVIDGRVDLTDLLAESFWLAWPYRFLCRPDCAGLCLTCGADLNQGACGCPRPDQ